MRDLLNEQHIEKLNDLGILLMLIPYPHEIKGTKEEAVVFAVKYLKSNYNLNWGGSALIGLDLINNRIILRLMNLEVLQLLLVDSGLGSQIFDEFASLAECVEV